MKMQAWGKINMNDNPYFEMSFEEKKDAALKAIEGQPDDTGMMIKKLDEQIESLKGRDINDTTEISLISLVCLMRHYNALFDQSSDSRPASLGEACTFCPLLYLGECEANEFVNLDEVIKFTGMKIRHGRKKLPSSDKDKE